MKRMLLILGIVAGVYFLSRLLQSGGINVNASGGSGSGGGSTGGGVSRPTLLNSREGSGIPLPAWNLQGGGGAISAAYKVVKSAASAVVKYFQTDKQAAFEKSGFKEYNKQAEQLQKEDAARFEGTDFSYPGLDSLSVPDLGSALSDINTASSFGDTGGLFTGTADGIPEFSGVGSGGVSGGVDFDPSIIDTSSFA